MYIIKVKDFFTQMGKAELIHEFSSSSATVELAALALGVKTQLIAKTIALSCDQRILLVVTAGDAKIDNAKYRNQFNNKAKMLTPDQVIQYLGQEVGGVCPFCVDSNIEIYLDISLQRFSTIYPAAGSSNSAICLTIAQLQEYTNYSQWIDVCKDWQEIL